MYLEAQKAGLDLGDLEEYGFDYNSMTFSHAQTFEDFEEKFTLLGNRIYDVITGKMSKDWNEAQCQPAVRNHVTPRVQIIWNYWPFNVLLGWIGWLANCPLMFFCSIFFFPAYIICILPCNICLYTVVTVLIALFFVTLPCVTCVAGFLQMVQS